MIEFIIATTKHILADWQTFLIGGLVVVWAIITFEGFVKMGLKKLIKNKTLIGFILAILSLVFVFPATALYLWLENISFDYYWFAYPAFCVATVLTYWVYEFFGIRLSVKWVLDKVCLLLRNIFNKICDGKKVNVKNELTQIYNDIKKEVKKEVKKKSKELTKSEKTDLDKL